MSFFNTLNKMLNEVSQVTLDKVADKFIKGGEEESKVKDYLARFNELSLKQRLKGIDVMSFKTFKDLQRTVDEVGAEKSKSEVKKEISLKDADKILENERFLIISPKTYEATCKYGKGTKWCIASTETPEHWANYNKKAIKFYFIFDKTKKEDDPYYKIAIVVPPSGILQAYDAQDNQIEINEVPTLLKSLGLDRHLFKPKELTEDDWINSWIEDETRWKRNSDGTIDVKGDILIQYNRFKKLPVKFSFVSGKFLCDHNNLETLEGSPQTVEGSFDCSYNNLKTLEGGPMIVSEDYDCIHNAIESLKGSPEEVGGIFNCGYNELISLEGAPKKVWGFACINNKKEFSKEEVEAVTKVEDYIYNVPATVKPKKAHDI
jgi:hypothetical protein